MDRYTYGCVNMILRGDGQSNMIHGDCFGETERNYIADRKCTVGFINPPYKMDTHSELDFIDNMLDVLEPGGCGIAIVPVRCRGNKDRKSYESRKKILQKHTLEAVMTMPKDLFGSIHIETCVMIFTAKRPHNADRKTWFATCKDDGFTSSNRSRCDTEGKWEDIKKFWVNSYINREEIEGFSLKQSVTASDTWGYEVYAKTDFSTLTDESFKQVIKEYTLFMLSQTEV